MTIRVFISHSHEDNTLSEAVVTLLHEALGLHYDEILNTSQATTGLSAGALVSEELRNAMVSAEV